MTDLPNYPTINLLGIKVHAMTMDQLLSLCGDAISKKTSLLLGVLNVAKLVNSQKDYQLLESLKEADYILADGLPIVWMSKMIGESLPQRLAGIDIMFRLLEDADKNHYRVYFLGTKPEILDKVVTNAKIQYPGLIVAGKTDGYFSDQQEQQVAQNIKDSNTDIAIVAMPSPKKENFLHKWREYMNVSVCHGVGGSFDVYAGVTRRAPMWMQKCGMEWFYRLIQEPSKMWKRYLVTNTIFLWLCLKAILRARL